VSREAGSREAGSGMLCLVSREAGLGMVTGGGDDDGGTVGSVEAEGRDSAASREAASMAWRRGRRQRRGLELRQPDGANQNFTVIRVSRRRGYSPYT
jgi:hypothetical protein